MKGSHPADTTSADQINADLADFVGQFYDDPLGFVMAMFPWGEPGPLEDFDGPDVWQREFLEWLGGEVKARRFDGSTAVPPMRAAVSSGHGTGKGQWKESSLDTPDGVRRWGDLKAGDRVFGQDGHPTRVVATHELGQRQLYRVIFDDGSSALVTGDHLWNVRGRRERRRNLPGWRTLSTDDIIAKGVQRPNGIATAKQWEIPVQGLAMFPVAEQALHPYVLGLWLGDGCKGKPGWHKPYPELVDRVRAFGYTVSTSADGGTQRVLGSVALFQGGVFECHSHERYIPENYKYASAEQRKELLRGLLDTDGEVQSSGAIGYASTSERLTHDIVWLVRSLGGKAWVQAAVKDAWYPHPETSERIHCKACYRVTIQLDWNPFTVAHRREAWTPSEHRYRVRWIDRIETAHVGDAMCITVAAPDGLYLANDFIVTHNSTLQAWVVTWIMSTRPYCRGTVTANTSTQLDTKTWAAIQYWAKLSLAAHWFEVNSARYYYRGHRESWFCAPQSCREENSEAFAGQHAANSTSFYVFDEDSAVSDTIHDVAQGGLTDGEPMWFLFGNATRSTGAFYRACFGADQHRWKVWVIDSRSSRFTNKAQIAEWIQDFGEDSDFVRVRVRGLPPRASDAQFISQQAVSDAQRREVAVLPDEPLVAGLDVARGGDDECVIRFRRGLDARSIPAIRIPGEQARDSMKLVSIAAEVLTKTYDGRRVAVLFVDATGGSLGGPVADRLRQLGHANVVDVQFGGLSPEIKCANMRAYIWDRMRTWLDRGAIDASPDLETDLTGPGYGHDKQDRLVLESKESMKKRGLSSPDDGDALAVTFAQAVAPKRAEADPIGYDRSDSHTAWMS